MTIHVPTIALPISVMIENPQLIPSFLQCNPTMNEVILEAITNLPTNSLTLEVVKIFVNICGNNEKYIFEFEKFLVQIQNGDLICGILEYAANYPNLIASINRRLFVPSAENFSSKITRTQWLRIHKILCSIFPDKQTIILDQMMSRHLNDNDSLQSRLELSIFFWDEIGGPKLITISEIISALTMDKSTQKNAKWILEKMLSQLPGDSDDTNQKTNWNLWFQLFDAIDEYSSHLFKSIFVKVLLNLVIDHNNDSSSILTMTPETVFVLIERCLNHDNDHVIKHAVVEIIQNESLSNKLFAEKIVNENNVQKFLSLIEKRCVTVFQKADLANHLQQMLRSWCNYSSRINQQILFRVIRGGDAKIYFPIIHCYLSVVDPIIVDSADLSWLLQSLIKFGQQTILCFPAIVRPQLKRLLCKQIPEKLDFSDPFLVGLVFKTCNVLESGLVPKMDAFRFLTEIVDSTKNYDWVEYSMIESAIKLLDNTAAELKNFKSIIGCCESTRSWLIHIAASRLRGYSMVDRPVDCGTIDRLIELDEMAVVNLPIVIARIALDKSVGVEIEKKLMEKILSCMDDPSAPRSVLSLTVALSILSELSSTLIDLSFISRLLRFTIPRIHFPNELLVAELPELRDSKSFCRFDTMENIYEQYSCCRWKLIGGSLPRILAHSDETNCEENFFDLLIESFDDSLSSETLFTYNEIVRKLVTGGGGVDFRVERMIKLKNFHAKFLDVSAPHLLVKRKKSVVAQFSTPALADLLSTIALVSVHAPEKTPFFTFFNSILRNSPEPQTSRVIASTVAQILVSKSHSDLVFCKTLIDLISELIVCRENFDENDTEGRQGVVSTNHDDPSVELTSACSRVYVLSALRNLGDSDLNELLVEQLMKKIREFQLDLVRKKAPLTPLPFSPFHRIQLRVFQAISYLAPSIRESTWVDTIFPHLFGSILKWPNQPDSRDYLECIAIFGLTRGVESQVKRAQMIRRWIIPALADHTMPSQSIASFVLVGGYLVSRSKCGSCGDKDSDLAIVTRDLVFSLIPFLSSNIAYIRGVSQQWLLEAFSNGVLAQLQLENDSSLNSFVKFVSSNKEAVAMRQRLVLIYNEWDPIEVIEAGKILTLAKSNAMFKNGEFVPSWIFMDTIKDGVHDSLESNWFYTREMEQYLDAASVGTTKTTNCEVSNGDNSQRKYDPSVFGHIFPGAFESCDSLEEQRRQKATDLIVVTTLVEKTTNIAGLFRSAEVFGAKKIVIASKCILRDPDFKCMSVTADKWIDFEEVSPSNLPNYIARMKLEERYTVVCLEQTHHSVKIGEFEFPKKTLLVLGNEKSGVDAEFLPLMDVCVEIPQRGVIRSLNVHVSGALAIWEYNQSLQ